MEAAETARKAECAGVLRLHLSDPGSRAKRGTPHSASTFFFFLLKININHSVVYMHTELAV